MPHDVQAQRACSRLCRGRGSACGALSAGKSRAYPSSCCPHSSGFQTQVRFYCPAHKQQLPLLGLLINSGTLCRCRLIEPREARSQRSGGDRRAKAQQLPEVHWHTGPKPSPGFFGSNTWRKRRRRERPQSGLPLAIPLVHVLNYLQDTPPWCCFAPDKAQVRCRSCITTGCPMLALKRLALPAA